ncbi:MAG: fructosamine kinase family protein [Rhodocyclaceae bacterium]|nr:fructosamine kinase family protein [Rhodocyclaceae bacterium]
MAAIFARNRLLPQLHQAAGNGMERKLVERGEALADAWPRFCGLPSVTIACYMATCGAATPAALVSDGTPVIFDPAAYYGDRETDLAMTELFGGFPEAFYAAYRLAWPLDAGYETRKTLYNLQFAGLEHLVHDVRAADELAPDVELGNGRPVGEFVMPARNAGSPGRSIEW